jgi:hypothetical protein
MAYDVHDQLIATKEGIEQVRLCSTKLAKRLTEELLPIAEYIQARYRAGYRCRVRWLSGSQSYDAVLQHSGDGVPCGLGLRTLLDVGKEILCQLLRRCGSIARENLGGVPFSFLKKIAAKFAIERSHPFN